MIKKSIRLIIVILVFIFLFDKLSLLFVRKGNGYGTDVLNFYVQPKDSIDIIYFGSSHAYTAFNPYLIEEQTGLSGYVFATQQQPLWITYHYLKEALKYQNPRYIVLELHMAIVQSDDYAAEGVNRDAIDKMKLSKNKFDVISDSVEADDDKMSYYFNIIKYHNRYKEINKTDLKTAFFGYTVDNKGYIGLEENNYSFIMDNTSTTNNIANITKKNQEYLTKIIEIVKERNIKLILVKTPTNYNIQEKEKLNYIREMAKKENILYLDYVSNIEKVKLDYNNDFYDNGHLNKNGSNKFSIKFIEDLESNYILE